MTDSTHAARFLQVLDCLQRYFDALYSSDAEALAQLFHPQAVYACATDGELLHLDMGRYLPRVAERESPASRAEARLDEVLGIEFSGPVTALARVRCRIGPKHFTDQLNFIYLDGRWQIIAKVFDYQTLS